MIKIDGRDREAVVALETQFSRFGDYGPQLKITEEMIRTYADESGDFNPRHIKDGIAHGDLLLQKLPLLRPSPLFQLIYVEDPFKMRAEQNFPHVVLVGDTIYGRERVSRVFYKKQRFLLTFEYEVRVSNYEDKIALKGTVTLRYPLESNCE